MLIFHRPSQRYLNRGGDDGKIDVAKLASGDKDDEDEYFEF